MNCRFAHVLVLLASSVSTAAFAQNNESSAPPQDNVGAPPPSSDINQGDLVAPPASAPAPAPAPVSAPAQAQDTGGIEDIVVTATRREERLQDVPVAVTAITSSTLASAGVSGLRDLTVVVPGFQGGRNATVNQPTIRGVGSSGVGMADESNVATYVDGVYQPFSFTSAQDLVEIERVEVLRGPQGTVFGRNATGGLVNVITPDPKFETEGHADVRIGRFRQDTTSVEGRGYVTTGLTQTMAVDAAVLYRDTGDYLKDLVRPGNKLGGTKSLSLRSKLLVQPSDAMRFVFTAGYQDLESSQNSVIPYKGDTNGRRFPGYINVTSPWEVSNNQIPQSDFDRLNLALQTQFDLGFASLQTTTGYQKVHVAQNTDSDASNIFLGQIPFTASGKSWSQEVRLLSTNPGRLKWILGFYAFDLTTGWKNIRVMSSSGAPGAPIATTRLDPNAKTRSYAGFGEATYELVDTVFLTGGVRYSTEKRKFSQTVNGVPLSPTFGPSPRFPAGNVAKVDFNKWTYRFALRWNFSDRGNIYASYGTGFKSGVFNELSTSPIAVRPETIKAWEGGVKIDPLPWLRTNLSVFHYDYADLQVQVRQPGAIVYTLQNAANAELYGGELEITAAPTPDLNLRAAATYLHAEYTNFPGAPAFVPNPDGLGGNIDNRALGDASGRRMIRSPRHTFSAGFDWGHDLGGGRFGVNGSIYHTTRLFYDVINQFSQDPYTTISGEISWTTPDEAWRFSLWGRNLTNEAIIQNLRVGSVGTDAIYDRPREVGVGASFRF
ncbi:MAG: TonB-dependent receptor [Alphaproteobacteria bacterium]|nr:TonB-dependent receptor [Alphaproteobacteria bacterium]